MNEVIGLGEEVDRALVQTMEGMAFTDAMRIEDGDLAELAADALWARIEVVEPAAGELVLLMGDDLASELEEATTGEPSKELSTRLEVLGEMLNTLAGSWARQLVSEETSIALSIPQTGHGSWVGGAEYELAIYETDDEERIVLALKR